ncbi:MAG: hypothetical protein LUE89_11445 [Clostridiales bacterium]|nr:hypothetical protein [Clostridiales bacterium]
MAIKKLTELDSVTPESGTSASVYGEYGGKVVKMPYNVEGGEMNETVEKLALLTGYVKLSVNADDMGLDATIWAEEEET